LKILSFEQKANSLIPRNIVTIEIGVLSPREGEIVFLNQRREKTKLPEPRSACV
jgi:hypothetical protein